MFHVGQKVVCVDTAPSNPHRAPSSIHLQKGAIYEIRWVGEMPYAADREPGKVGLRLTGIVRGEHPIIPEYSDYPFSSFRFRPIVERKTDISVFTEMLTPKRVNELVAVTQDERGIE